MFQLWQLHYFAIATVLSIQRISAVSSSSSEYPTFVLYPENEISLYESIPNPSAGGSITLCNISYTKRLINVLGAQPNFYYEAECPRKNVAQCCGDRYAYQTVKNHFIYLVKNDDYDVPVIKHRAIVTGCICVEDGPHEKVLLQPQVQPVLRCLPDEAGSFWLNRD
ncbi:hypothetical protein CHUAL_006974 [Chamberlinius hualienensis]